MDNLLETAAIVEQDYSQEEETKAIDAADDSVEGGNPAVVDLLICIALAREAESEHSDKVGTVSKDVEDEEERLEQVWLLISISDLGFQLIGDHFPWMAACVVLQQHLSLLVLFLKVH